MIRLSVNVNKVATLRNSRGGHAPDVIEAVEVCLAAGVPGNRPGRGLSRDGFHLLTAVPRIDGRPSGDGLAAATADLVDAIAARWAGPPALAVPSPVMR